MTKLPTMSRRFVLLASVTAFFVRPDVSYALAPSAAEKLVASAVADINRIIASGKGEAAVLQDFRNVFQRYGDVRGIALTTLGPARRSASNSQVNAYVNAFQTYFTNKYGRRFKEFEGGEIVIESTREANSYVEVRSKANLAGQKPFALFWRVSDRSGAPKIQNMIIGGINVLTNERNSIRNMLDRAGGDVDALTARLIEES